jgi:hypothetical protein
MTLDSKIWGVLLIWRLVSDIATASLPYSGGPLTENCRPVYRTQNLPYLTVESRSGDPLLASMPRTF